MYIKSIAIMMAIIWFPITIENDLPIFLTPNQNRFYNDQI